MYPPPTSTSSWVRPSTKRCTDATNVECPTPIWKCSVRDTRSSRVSDICPWTLLPRTFLLPTISCRHETMCIDGMRRILSCHTYIITLHTNLQTPGYQEFSMHLKQADDILMFHNAGAFCCQLIIVILLLYNVPRYWRAASVISWKWLGRMSPKCSDVSKTILQDQDWDQDHGLKDQHGWERS